MSPSTGGGRAIAFAGAFAPSRRLEASDMAAARLLLSRMAEAGLTMLLTEGERLPEWLASVVHDAGLRLAGGLACFSDHAGSIRPVDDALRPIAATGAQRPQLEWYRGIIPTDPGYEDDLVRACRDAAARLPIDLFALDFMRWPLHSELEMREGARVIDSSFDPTTLGRFRSTMDVDIPVDDPGAAAARIHDGLIEEWTTFKCHVISGLVARIAREIRVVRPELPLGAYIVPGDDAARRRYAGQDVTALGTHLDVLLPMAYHAILGKEPAWVGEVVADVRGRAGIPVVPVIQATADPAVAGPNDWGAPFPPAALGEAIDAGLLAGGHGFVVFPAHGLDEERLAQLPVRSARVAAPRR